jgi:hypothetical protein
LLKANRLQLEFCQFQRHGRAVLASLLVALVLLLDGMAACPALHELIHHDADAPGHECAVTLFAHGQVDSPVVEVVAAILPAASVEFLLLTPVSVFNLPVATLPPGRAPPVSLLHS